MKLSKVKTLAFAVAMSCLGSSAFAVTVTPFTPTIAGGQPNQGSAIAMPGENFLSTVLSFAATTNLLAGFTITINPYLVSPSGTPSNSIALGWSLNGGAVTPLSVTQVLIPIFGPIYASIGAAGGSASLKAGDLLSFVIGGTAGPSGNQVTFQVETERLPDDPVVPDVPVLPAGAFIISGLGALGLVRSRRKTA